jgi:hypothetical protein
MSQNYNGPSPLRAFNETTSTNETIIAPLNDNSVTGNEPLLPIAACTGIGGSGGVWFSIPLFEATATALQRQQQNRLAVSVGANLAAQYHYSLDIPNITNYDTAMQSIFSNFSTDSGSTVYDEIYINTTNHAGGTHIFVTFILYA